MYKKIVLTIISFLLISTSSIFISGCAKAEFEVAQITISPNQVYSGESVTIKAIIQNSGNADGVYSAVLNVNGVEKETKEVVIKQNSSQEVTFILIEQSSGTYEISIGEEKSTYTVLKQPSGAEIANNVIKAMYDIKTYQFEQGLSFSMEGIIDGDEADMDINMELTGTVDKINRRLLTEGFTTLKLTSPEEYELLLDTETYNIGNTSYTFTSYDGEPYGWTKERWSFGSWGNVSGIELELELLATSTVEYIGIEEIRGRACYVIQIVPTTDELANALIEYSTTSSGDLPLNESAYNRLAEDSIVKHWIYKDNYYLGKFEISMEGLMPISMLEMSGTGFVDVTFIINSTFYNYNEQVNIELPPDAQEAISFDEGTGEQDAKDTELANVQAATVALMVDNEIYLLPNPVTTPTNDMSAFPDAISVAGSLDKRYDVYGNKYTTNDLDGYILYHHDMIADGSAIKDLVNYIATRYSVYKYTVDEYGTVTQWD